MPHKVTPDWFYSDELEIEAGLANLAIYTSDREDEAGRLFLTVDAGDGEREADLTYNDVADIHRFLAEWLMWAEDNGYDEA